MRLKIASKILCASSKPLPWFISQVVELVLCYQAQKESDKPTDPYLKLQYIRSLVGSQQLEGLRRSYWAPLSPGRSAPWDSRSMCSPRKRITAAPNDLISLWMRQVLRRLPNGAQARYRFDRIHLIPSRVTGVRRLSKFEWNNSHHRQPYPPATTCSLSHTSYRSIVLYYSYDVSENELG